MLFHKCLDFTSACFELWCHVKIFSFFILQELIAFQTDKSIEVRKFVIGFIEEAWWVPGLWAKCKSKSGFAAGLKPLCFYSKRDNELLLRLIANLNMLLKDESVNVVKKAILTLTQLYKVTLQVKLEFKKNKTRHQTPVLWKSISSSSFFSLSLSISIHAFFF